MKNIILFGDSLFNGYRNHQDTNLITNGLQNTLGRKYHVSNLSQSGATTADGLNRLNLIDDDADLVVLEFGTNDSSSGWGISSSKYAQNLAKMVDSIGAKRMIIVGPAYPNPQNAEIMTYYTNDNLALFNHIASSCAAQYHIPFIDLIAIWSNLVNISSYYQSDGQHFTDKGNQLLITTVAKAIKN